MDEQPVIDHAGIVRQNVQTTPLLANAIDTGLRRGGVGHVGLQGDGGTALFLDGPYNFIGSGLVATVDDTDASALGSERLGDATTDAAAAARHEGHLILQLHGFPSDPRLAMPVLKAADFIALLIVASSR